MAELETPDDPESIYLARLDDVGEHRPLFTGDVYRLWDGRRVMILQPPCALRAGVNLHSRLLVAPVSPDTTLRSSWAKAPFAKMPLPKLIEETPNTRARHAEMHAPIASRSSYQRNNQVIEHASRGRRRFLDAGGSGRSRSWWVHCAGGTGCGGHSGPCLAAGVPTTGSPPIPAPKPGDIAGISQAAAPAARFRHIVIQGELANGERVTLLDA